MATALEHTAITAMRRSAWRRRRTAARRAVAGFTIPLGPLGLSLGLHPRGAVALALGIRKWLR